MKHTSIRMETPCEFINITPINPLISKCQIKVCYVSDEPNRNLSVITKDVARNLANSLPGSPIVGYYNEMSGDFEEHNRIISITNGKFEIKDTTRPYGFVDLNAKVWFQKFLDDGVNEREYLMTEGYLWTGQYPECQRIVENGNNQSMELDENYLNATWSKDDNGNPKFFIINEAIISKLCILGEEFEPCFEGSQIDLEFSFNDSFKTQLFAMMNEIKELLKEGGAKKVFNVYSVEIGEALWNDVYTHLEKTYPGDENYFSAYSINGVLEEDEQKFIVLKNRSNSNYYRLNFDLNEENNFVPSETLIEVTENSDELLEACQFALENVVEYEIEYAKKKKEEEEDKNNKDTNKNSENNTEDGEEKKCSKCGKPLDECECEGEEDGKKKSKYNLEDVIEYNELKEQYDELMVKFNALKIDCESLEAEIEPLRVFKLEAEKKAKLEMIDQFYMLSDEDKADVLANIDTYSVDDIEAKLSIICVRNKVSFDLDENKNSGNPTVYNLNNGEHEEDAAVPAWVKSLRNTAKSMS